MSNFKLKSSSRPKSANISRTRRFFIKFLTIFSLATTFALLSVIAPTRLRASDAKNNLAVNVGSHSTLGFISATDGFYQILNFFGFGLNSDDSQKDNSTRVRGGSPAVESQPDKENPGKPEFASDAAPDAIPCTFGGTTRNVPSAYPTIQSAINASGLNTGDTIQVAAGTYYEQLIINRCVNIVGSGQGSTIIQNPIDPMTMQPLPLALSSVPGVNAASIIEVRNSRTVGISNLTISGPVVFPGGANPPDVYGIFVIEDALLKMTNATVTKIRKQPLDGVQNGDAVRAGSVTYNQTGALDFTGVTISDYQKTGIIVSNSGSTASIKDGFITGAGAQTDIAQNGIQINDGATATITNNTFTGNVCDNPACTFTNYFSYAIIGFNTGALTITGNTFKNNDAGIYAWSTTTAITNNTFNQTRYIAVDLDEGTHNVATNFINGGVFSGATNGPRIGVNAASYNGATGNTISTIFSNSIINSIQSGIELNDYASDAYFPTANVSFTRLANVNAGGAGIDNNTTTSSVSQMNNFWGCNLGYNGGTGCDAALGAVDMSPSTNPFLILDSTTSTTSVNTGGTATITADLRFNSIGTNTYTATNHLPNPIPSTASSLNTPNGIPVSFSSNMYGSVAPAIQPLVNGQAQTTFTGGGVFSGDQTAIVTTQVDNATDTVNITVEDTTVPTVTINQKSGQADPTNIAPVEFTAVFSEAVGISFTDADVTISGVTYSSIVVTDSGDNKNFNIAVTPTSSGIVTATIDAGKATDPAGNPNDASTSTDNQVTFFTGAIEFVVDDLGINCLANGAPVYTTIQAAVAAASPNYIIRVCSGSYTTPASPNPGITISQSGLTIVNAETTKPTVNIPYTSSGTGHGFEIYAPGVTLDGLNFVKSDTFNNHNLIGVLANANNFTLKNSSFNGPNWQTSAAPISRGIEVTSGLTGLLITNNTFQNLRQPAYINGGGVGSPVMGTVSNNTVTGTKGFVVAGASINFTGNVFGQTCIACQADIALLSNVDPVFYSNLLTLSTNNDNALISAQFFSPRIEGRAVSYVNKSAAANGDGRVAYPYQTIALGISTVAPAPAGVQVGGTLPGGTVNVAAGTYPENVTVDRQLTILGPNAAINPNTGTRGAEAIIVPATSDPLNNSTGPIVVDLTAEGVIFKGFTIDGNNPAINSGILFNGVDVDANQGISGTGTLNPNAQITNNIIQNIGEFGIFLYASGSMSGTKTDSTVSNNKVDNITGAFGQGIRTSDDSWSSITNNVVTRVRNGIVIENFSGLSASGHPASVVGNNSISSFGIGIRPNLHYNYTNPGYTISNNTITSYVQTTLPTGVNQPAAESGYRGIRIESIQQNVPLTVRNNTITVNRAALQAAGYIRADGIWTTNTSMTSPNVLVTENFISGAIRGIAHTAPANLTVTCNVITGNNIGVFVGTGIGFGGSPSTATAGITIQSNNILGNNLYGVQTETAGGVPQSNAENNYWGAANGPSSDGTPGNLATGSGDRVSTNVDFIPFSAAPTNCSPTAPTPPPTVTINQGGSQADPTSASPIAFDVVFSEPVTGFDASDIDLTGSSAFATGDTPVINVAGSGSTYTVTVSGMTRSGTVTAKVKAGAATGASGASVASTSTDNTVFYNFVVASPTNTTQVVNPVNITTQQFAFVNEGATGSGAFVTGPASPPLNIGSAQLTIDSTGRENLATARYGGTRLADISSLQYSAYTNRSDNLTVVLSFDVDYDLTDTNYTYQNRLVYEPAAQGIPVAQNTWKDFDTLAGKFYSSNNSNPGGLAGCTQATPCTKQQLLALFPNVGIYGGVTAPFQGGLYLRVGGPWAGTTVANTDKLIVGVNGNTTTFDFEPTPPTVSISDAAAVTEGDSGSVTATFTISLTGGPSQLDTSVTYSTANGSATAGDYTPVTNTATILAGQSSVNVTVNVNGDNLVEGNETFFVNLSNAVNATINDGQGLGTITDDDVAGTVQFSSTTYSVGEAGGTASITITRTGGNDGAVSVTCSTSNGTATAPADYAATLQIVTFADQDSAPKTCSVPIVNDNISEPAETVNLSLSNVTGTGATLGSPSTAVLTITDNGNFISISGNIQQYNAPSPNTNLSGVMVTLSGSASATTTTDSNGNYIFNGGLPAGTNNYLVTPSLAGKVFDPTNRSYVNVTSNVTNANFVAYNTGAVPRNVRVVNTSQATYTSNVTVPITLDSMGTENALSFSLNYNPALLQYSSIACGSDAPGCSVSASGPSGTLGVEITRADSPPNTPTTFAAGSGREVVLVTFTTTPGSAFNTPITFGNSPTVRDVNDVDGNSVPANYINGQVIFAQGIEGDVAGRPTGNGSLNGTDVTVLRGFVSGAFTPDPNYNEFQRADVAPAGSKGNGFLSSADITTLRNYVANSTLTPVGGPNQAASPLFEFSSLENEKLNLSKSLMIAPGNVRVVNTDSSPGSSVSVPIQLDSEGLENGVSISFQFDQSKLTYTGATLGSDVTSLPNTTFDINTTQLASGRVGLALTLNVGATFTTGTKNIFVVNFTVKPTAAPGNAAINFVANQPLLTEVNDPSGNTLSVFPGDFISGGVNVLDPTAASASVGGSVVTANGQSVTNARVSLTDSETGIRRTVLVSSFGRFLFDDVQVGRSYVLSVDSKRYAFRTQVINVIDKVADLTLTAEQ